MLLYETEIQDTSSMEFASRNWMFWKIIRNKLLYEEELFSYFEDCVINFIANFSDSDLMRIDKYMIDLFGELSGYEGFDEIIKLSFKIDDKLEFEKKRSKELHDEIKPKISKSFCLKNRGRKGYHIHCPITYYNITYNFQSIDENDEYAKLWNLRKYTRISHYYIMIYIYDITLKMQKIKSDIIKYELARYKKEQSKVLDFMINELTLELIKLNKELIIYHKKFQEFYYYCNHPYMDPNNNSLLTRYNKIYFDYKKNLPNSVVTEKLIEKSKTMRKLDNIKKIFC
tara:strand:- start:7063 stop:7917 length:855 start_codon:yes stop_codon:yes gene_type:complete